MVLVIICCFTSSTDKTPVIVPVISSLHLEEDMIGSHFGAQNISFNFFESDDFNHFGVFVSGLSFMCCKSRERPNGAFYGAAFSFSEGVINKTLIFEFYKNFNFVFNNDMLFAEAEKDSKAGLLE